MVIRPWWKKVIGYVVAFIGGVVGVLFLKNRFGRNTSDDCSDDELTRLGRGVDSDLGELGDQLTASRDGLERSRAGVRTARDGIRGARKDIAKLKRLLHQLQKDGRIDNQ